MDETIPNLIGELAESPEQMEKLIQLLYTWRDLLVPEIEKVPATDMI